MSSIESGTIQQPSPMSYNGSTNNTATPQGYGGGQPVVLAQPVYGSQMPAPHGNVGVPVPTYGRPANSKGCSKGAKIGIGIGVGICCCITITVIIIGALAIAGVFAVKSKQDESRRNFQQRSDEMNRQYETSVNKMNKEHEKSVKEMKEKFNKDSGGVFDDPAIQKMLQQQGMDF